MNSWYVFDTEDSILESLGTIEHSLVLEQKGHNCSAWQWRQVVRGQVCNAHRLQSWAEGPKLLQLKNWLCLTVGVLRLRVIISQR